MEQIAENNISEDSRKYVEDFRGLLNRYEIAEKLGISYSLLSYIIRGERTDHYNAIEACKKAIEDKLQAIMPS